MEISAFKRDSKQVEAGQWVGDIPGAENARFRVRGLTSPLVVTLRARKERVLSRKGRNADGSLKPDVARQVLAEVLHEAVLLEWDGLTSGGKPIPYDAELAKKWLSDPDYEPFADSVVYAARVVDGATSEETDDAVGNSKRSSAGTSSGASAPQS